MTTGAARTEDVPEFSIVFRGESMEPDADVVPRGPVRFLLDNQSPAPHDFALVQFGDEYARVGRPLTEEDPALVGTVDALAPGESEEVTFDLREGRYLLVSNTPGEHLGTAFFELTVQPVGGAGRAR